MYSSCPFVSSLVLLIVVFTLLRPVKLGALRGELDVVNLVRRSSSSVKPKLRNVKPE